MYMKKIIIISILIILVISAFLFVKGSISTQQPNGGENSGINLPTNGNVTPSGSSTILIRTADNSTIELHNFLTDSLTYKDDMNEGYYFLGNNFQQTESDPEFVIQYIAETNSFIIALYQEPLAQARKNAEQYLIDNLGLSEEQMCSLRYSVSVPKDVNDFFAGHSLGFSFCPGSFPLE